MLAYPPQSVRSVPYFRTRNTSLHFAKRTKAPNAISLQFNMMSALSTSVDAGNAAHPGFTNSYRSSKTVVLLVLVNFTLNECIFRDFGLFPSTATSAALSSSSYWYWFCLIVRVFATGSLLMVWRCEAQRSAASGAAERPLTFAYALFPVLMNLAFAMFILAEVMSGSYSGKGDPFHYSPRYFAQFGLKAYPLLTFFLLRDSHPAAVLISWCIALVTLSVCCIYAQNLGAFLPLVVYVVISATIFYEHYQQNKALTVAMNTLDAQLAENARLSAHSQALELRAMIGNVAHDLKTPLTSFLSGTEHMDDIVKGWEDDLQTDKKELFMREAPQKLQALRTCLVNMNSTNSFMSMIINRCLDYTKTTKGFELVPKQDNVELRKKLLIPVQLIHDTHCYDNIKITVAPINPIITPHVITDREWLLENLLCLLSNAAKYSRTSCVDLSVELVPNALFKVTKRSDDTQPDAGQTTPQCLRFQVLDTGVGMTEDTMENLFNPFKQAERLAGGAGLGLFSLARRVEAMQGQYGVARRPDGEPGTMFWFTIPYHPVSVPVSAHAKFSPTARGDGHSCNRQQSNSAPAWDHFRVMIVDDAPLVVKMVRLLLTGKGHKVVEKAVNGEEAVKKLIQGYTSTEPQGEPPFDVVLMDLQMPVLDGIEAIRRLRAFERASQKSTADKRDGTALAPASHSPEQERPQPLAPIHTASTSVPNRPFHQFVVAFSANSDHETKQAAMEAGADAFLSKPFSYESFMEVVHGA